MGSRRHDSDGRSDPIREQEYRQFVGIARGAAGEVYYRYCSPVISMTQQVRVIMNYGPGMTG